MQAYLDTNTNELLFTLLSFSPGPFWLILALVPKHKLAMRAFDIYLILLSTVFAMLTIPIIPELLPIIASPKLHLLQQFYLLKGERLELGII